MVREYSVLSGMVEGEALNWIIEYSFLFVMFMLYATVNI